MKKSFSGKYNPVPVSNGPKTIGGAKVKKQSLPKSGKFGGAKPNVNIHVQDRGRSRK